ncbi:MAG: hypothetical protein RIS94_2324 [Pseudomonadota bacterium]|jgi:hypothetical protein
MTSEREDRLAAWLDGALPAQEAHAFEDELAADPQLAALAETWRANDARIARALAPIADAPIDDALLARMGLADAPASVIAAANDNPPFAWRRVLSMGGAVAAACAAFLVIVHRPAPSADPLSQALDRTAALATATLPDGARVQPTLTVRAQDGRWCREYREGTGLALACREPDGRWRVEGRGSGQGAASDDSIALAGGAAPNGLDPAYRRLGASDPVDAVTEARLIGDGWK